MNKELDEKLCKDFPKIFRDRHGSVRKTCMCWGFPNSGWEPLIRTFCRLAQNHIDSSRNHRLRYLRAKRLTARLVKENRVQEYYEKEYANLQEPYRTADILKRVEDPATEYLTWDGKDVEPQVVPQVVALQVKEKFGTLRFYYYGGDDYIDGLQSFMDYMSGMTCEDCGKPGKLRGEGWTRCLCNDCCGDRPTLEEEEEEMP